MKIQHGLALLFASFIVACQPAPAPTVTILHDQQIISLQTEENIPSRLLAQAGLTLGPDDRLSANGVPVPIDQPLSSTPITLQIHRAIHVTLVTPAGEQTIVSSASKVGEALADSSIWLRDGDVVFPGPDSPLRKGMIITLSPVRPIFISVDGKILEIQTSAQTVGEALAAAGSPLLGLDYSIPAEKEPLPAGGEIQVIRVSESLQLAQSPSPSRAKYRCRQKCRSTRHRSSSPESRD